MSARANGPACEGVLTALVTPFKDGAVDEEALRAVVEQQIGGGIDGLVACGTTGESPTLSTAEQERVVAACVQASRGRVPVWAGAGSNSTAHACELSAGARRAGADGLLLVTPYYNRPTQEGLVQHFRAIVKATPLPTILYNVPSRTGCDLLPETVARLCEVPEVVAIKEATGLPLRTSQILARTGDRLTVLSGDDLTALPLFAVGARGVISVTSNPVPAEMVAMWKAAAAGDYVRARRQHNRLLPLSEALFVESNPIPVKAAMSMLRLCRDEVRPPLTLLAGAGREKLRAALAALVPDVALGA
jgi:4-hydroxy-tetrahydrodipicolinate synthase